MEISNIQTSEDKNMLFEHMDVTATLKLSFENAYYRVPLLENYFHNVDTNRFGVRMLCRIKEIGEDSFTVVSPELQRRMKKFKQAKVDFSFTYINNIYFFAAEILKYVENDRGIIFSMPTSYDKIKQKRKNLRYFCPIPLEVTKIDTAALNGNSIPPRFETKDLSAEGLRIVTMFENLHTKKVEMLNQVTLHNNSVFAITLSLPGHKAPLSIDAEVKWVNVVGKSYERGLQFNDVKRQDQDTIARHIFKLQLDERKKSRQD